MSPTPLPIDPHLEEVIAALRRRPNLLLQAAPGTGKTTRVPPALLRSLLPTNREVWVLEPRRLAAKLAAQRVASELGESVGKTVGYQFRFEKVGGPSTRLRFVTEGILLRHLLSDPMLNSVGAVVLDEFHERHLHGDIALAYLRRLQKTRRPDLHLVVMSATLRTQELEAFLDRPTVLEVGAPLFPLKIQYQSAEETPLDRAVARAVKHTVSSADDTGGDFLVFLPGMADIRRAESTLSPLARERGWAVHALHGELSKEEQETAITPGKTRKIVLATNVAESSLTIEGVSIVIDSGLHRSASYSSWSGMPSLRTRPISKASAIQRAGRAARLGPGLCVRLYAQGDFEHRPAQETPEIQRADLAQTLLELKALGVEDEGTFEWLEKPSETSFKSARRLLYLLGALQAESSGSPLTPLGRELSRWPLHPRLGRLLVAGNAHGCTDDAIALAALLSEGELDSLDAIESVRRQPIPERARKQLQGWVEPRNSAGDRREALARCALAAYPDRVGKLRTGNRKELVLSSGGSVQTDDIAALSKSGYFVVLDAREIQVRGQARAVVRATSVAAIDPDWLLAQAPLGVTESDVLTWDSQRRRLSRASRLVYDQLVLEETEAALEPTPATVDALLRHALGIPAEKASSLGVHEWIEALLKVASRETLEGIFAREELIRTHAPGDRYPSILARIREALTGLVSQRELEALDWESALLPPAIFGRLFPNEIQLPGGRKVRVQYALGRAPWIESRLQDFFGLKQTPTLLDGKIPLTLHLLAPNHRAVQVTTDLASFWQNTYPTVRRELSRNYPRHAWPEDPVNAKPPAPKPRRH